MTQGDGNTFWCANCGKESGHQGHYDGAKFTCAPTVENYAELLREKLRLGTFDLESTAAAVRLMLAQVTELERKLKNQQAEILRTEETHIQIRDDLQRKLANKLASPTCRIFGCSNPTVFALRILGRGHDDMTLCFCMKHRYEARMFVQLLDDALTIENDILAKHGPELVEPARPSTAPVEGSNPSGATNFDADSCEYNGS